MNELNCATFVDTLRPALLKHTEREDAAIFLLNSMSEQKLTVVKRFGRGYKLSNGSSIKGILRGVNPISSDIRVATTKPEVAEAAANYFRNEVMEDLHPRMQEEVTDRLQKLIDLDATIPKAKREQLLKLLQGDDYGFFLSKVFLYAVNRPIQPDSETTDQKISIPLLIFLFFFGTVIYGMTMYTLIIPRIPNPLDSNTPV